MVDLTRARAEIEHAIGVLRSRYHYAHPIFDYLGNALEALTPEPEAPMGEPPVAEEEMSASDVGPEIEITIEPPLKRPGKRGKQ